jgi:hypothetical protein
MDNMEERQVEKLAFLPYCPYLITIRLTFLPYFAYHFAIFFQIFHIISQLNLLFFRIFHIFSLNSEKIGKLWKKGKWNMENMEEMQVE